MDVPHAKLSRLRSGGGDEIPTLTLIVIKKGFDMNGTDAAWLDFEFGQVETRQIGSHAVFEMQLDVRKVIQAFWKSQPAKSEQHSPTGKI